MHVRNKPGVGDRTIVGMLSLLVAMIMLVAVPVVAHTPAGEGYIWTCISGEGNDSPPVAGNCYVHHSNANARVYYESSVGGSWGTPVATGRAQWDKTNGHQFDFILESSDSGSNSNIRVITGSPCGDSSNLGCALMAAGSSHISEGSSYIEFKSTTTSSLRDDVATHEFGHLAGLGHSTTSSATMFPTVHSSATSLSYSDTRGRCQIYGHAHGYWGGC